MKKTIAVFFGGRSTEHDVSIVTALTSVIKPLELTNKYNVVPVYIAKNGAWYSDSSLSDIALYSSGKIQQFLDKTEPVGIELSGGLVLTKQVKFRGHQRIKIDVGFPAMHGTYGEDGALMGLLDMAGVAYVGCDMQSSVVAMDKILAKDVASSAGLTTVPDVRFGAEAYRSRGPEIVAEIENKLHYPVFVKPPHLGSSIGVMKVKSRPELEEAIETALGYDDKVLVELAVPHLREATLPVMGYGSNIVAALLEEPLVRSNDFFDFDVKYMNQGKGGKKMGAAKTGGKQGAQGYSKIPADFPKSLYDEAERVAVAGFKAAGCSGIARVDILINEQTQTVYFNEINPLPGSLYAHNWRMAGISNVELVDKLIGFAEERHAERAKITTSFETSFLKQF